MTYKSINKGTGDDPLSYLLLDRRHCCDFNLKLFPVNVRLVSSPC